MNILVTGAKGFIGTHLVKELSKSHNVFSYDLVDGQDIRNLHDLDKAFELSQCSMVIHLAARAGVRRSIDYPGEYITTNIEGTWNVGKMCEKYNCRLISFSSSSVYGNASPPTKEDDPKNPVSLYGMTKVCGENIVNNLTIPSIIIRPFTVYGNNGRGDQVFYKWINQYKGKQPITVYRNKLSPSCRGYTYVRDIISALQTLIGMTWEPCNKMDFNLGGEEVIPIDDLVEIFIKAIPDFGLYLTYCHAPKEDIGANYACIDRARNFLGFIPPRRFHERLTSIIKKELANV
jgi:UDP-glucuronate 4-epimerase